MTVSVGVARRTDCLPCALYGLHLQAEASRQFGEFLKAQPAKAVKLTFTVFTSYVPFLCTAGAGMDS